MKPLTCSRWKTHAVTMGVLLVGASLPVLGGNYEYDWVGGKPGFSGKIILDAPVSPLGGGSAADIISIQVTTPINGTLSYPSAEIGDDAFYGWATYSGQFTWNSQQITSMLVQATDTPNNGGTDYVIELGEDAAVGSGHINRFWTEVYGQIDDDDSGSWQASTGIHVVTAQDLQNALTEAANNGANNTIYLANGYYTGNFNYNSAANTSLTLMPEPSVTNPAITLDGAAGGRDLNITCTGSSGDVTVSGMTFVRNCGNSQIGALRIGASSGGTITVTNCQFLVLSNSEGMGLEITSGLYTVISNCTAIGKQPNGNDGTGIYITGVTGTNVIENSTFSGNYGHGLAVVASAILTVSNVIAQSNADYGIYANGPSFISVMNNVLTANAEGANLSASAALNLISNLFTSNTYSGGAAVSTGYQGTAVITGNTFYENSSIYGGGLSASASTLFVTNNAFLDNSTWNTSYAPPGAAELSADYGLVSGNTFTGNTSVYHGALEVAGSTLTISNNSFDANQCNNQGGAIYAYGVPALLVTANRFTGNTCGGSGGAICVDEGEPTIIGNTFQRNSSAYGGGAIYANTDDATITDNLIVNNSQSGASYEGGGIYVAPSLASSMIYVINNTLFGNTSAGGGGGLAIQNTQTSGTQAFYVFNNIIWGNSSASGAGSDVYLTGGGSPSELECNDYDSSYGVWTIAQSNVDVSPQFFNPVAGDFHFPSTSLCWGAGTANAPSLPANDLDGNPRLANASVDMGCYELTTNVFHPADTNQAWTITAGEFAAYAAAWKSGQGWSNAPPNPIPANYVTRAGFLMTNGGAYYNDGSTRPVNWKIQP